MENRTKKFSLLKMLSIVLSFTMLLSLLPVSPFTVTAIGAEAVQSGTCGENLTWTLDSEGTLTISGTGGMLDYSSGGSPWYVYRNSIKNAVIEDGVTSIGRYAFYGCGKMSLVVIPASVTSIRGYAFNVCTNLKKVYASSLVSWLNISFGSDRSNPCSNGTDLYIGGELLTELVIPDGVTSIGEYAFYGCKSFTSVTIPEGVTSIGYAAF